MSRLFKLTIAALAVLGAVQARAAQTNLVQTISMSITAYAEDDTVTNGVVVTRPVTKEKRSTANIIQLIGDAMGQTFSSKSKLLLISALETDDIAIVVQDGTNRTDVTGFFEVDDSSGTSVTGFTLNTITGIIKATEYEVFELKFRDNGGQTLSAHFDVSGFATVKAASVTVGKPAVVIGESHSITATLAGTGDFTDNSGTHDMIVQVTLATGPAKLEVLP